MKNRFACVYIRKEKLKKKNPIKKAFEKSCHDQLHWCTDQPSLIHQEDGEEKTVVLKSSCSIVGYCSLNKKSDGIDFNH